MGFAKVENKRKTSGASRLIFDSIVTRASGKSRQDALSSYATKRSS